MIVYCPRIDDAHLSGPHRIVIPVSARLTWQGDRRVVTSVVGHEHVICVTCDHWVIRVPNRCQCYCHREARNS